jgi:hypothetical protein
MSNSAPFSARAVLIGSIPPLIALAHLRGEAGRILGEAIEQPVDFLNRPNRSGQDMPDHFGASAPVALFDLDHIAPIASSATAPIPLPRRLQNADRKSRLSTRRKLGVPFLRLTKERRPKSEEGASLML